MELIRHTIEYIRTTPLGETILSLDEVTEGYVKDVVSYTPLYRPFDRIKIIRDNTCPRVHPFFIEYVALQKLCVQILRQEDIKYGDNDNNRINGILFDGAWLWEEYLNVLLQNLGFRHPENKLGIGAIYLFEQGGQRYPDFWKEDIVLDAKYKRLAQNGNRLDVDRNDIHQVMAYMYRLKASKGGIICPFIGARNKVISEKMHRDSYKGTLSLYTLAVPSGCESYSEFVGKMHKNELDFIQAIVESVN